MRIISPADDSRIVIPADSSAPPIPIRTDGSGVHQWSWIVTWRHFRRQGAQTSSGNSVDLGSALANLGGRLDVIARVGGREARLTLKIVGTNPGAADVQAYLRTLAGSDGFFAIINHETHARHFTPRGEPIRSFDNGYGICQLTTPPPTFEQCWSWKRNIDAGLVLFRTKQSEARAHLSQQNRSYTAEQLTRETVSRWNGGAYHRWDGRSWVRNPDILCAPGTGNIGWDMTDSDNAGRTLEELRRRDGDAFRRPRPRGADWRYLGVCYADALLGG